MLETPEPPVLTSVQGWPLPYSGMVHAPCIKFLQDRLTLQPPSCPGSVAEAEPAIAAHPVMSFARRGL